MKEKDFRKEYCKRLFALGFRYIAKDKDEKVYIYTTKPVKSNRGAWKIEEVPCKFLQILICDFEELKWEDKKPVLLKKFM